LEKLSRKFHTPEACQRSFGVLVMATSQDKYHKPVSGRYSFGMLVTEFQIHYNTTIALLHVTQVDRFFSRLESHA